MDIRIQNATQVPASADGAGAWTFTRVLVVALCFALNMLDGADLLVMSFIAPVIATQWTISPERLGFLFSASLVGMAMGCVLVAPLGDRYGRRALILGGLTLAAAAMAFSAFSHDVSQLIVARLIVGIGVGTIGVTMTSLAAEYAPTRSSSFAVGFVQAGWPLGSIITALVVVRMMVSHGWPAILLGIGAVSGALLLVSAAALPESMAFLQINPSATSLARLNQIRRRLKLASLTEVPVIAAAPRAGVAALFRGERALPSSLLWSAVTLGYFVLYFVISWIPKLVIQAGLPLDQGIFAGATYNLGAFIGTACIGGVGARYGLIRTVATFLATAAVVMVIFGAVAMPVALTLLVALLVGVTVQGGFNGFWAVAARLYPADVRNTGIGWALGVGRVGAVLGPIAGGYLVGASVPMPIIFALFAAPLLIAAAMTLRIRLP